MPSCKKTIELRMQLLQYDLHHQVANQNLSTHMATQHDSNCVDIPLRSATIESTTPHIYAQTHNEHAQSSLKPALHCGKKNIETSGPRPPTQSSCPSSPPAATLQTCLPNTSPLQHSCGHYIVICTTKWQTKMYLRTWQHNMETIIQPLQCDLQPRIPQDHRTTHISQSHKFTTSPLL